MSFESARTHLEQLSLADRISVTEKVTHTVAQAAAAFGVAEQHIAKTLAFRGTEPGIGFLVVAAGDARISNSAFKQRFGVKASMLDPESVVLVTGHEIGGVCPFANPEGTEVYLDESLKRFETVYPACGSANSSVRLSLAELERASGAKEWVHVTNIPD